MLQLIITRTPAYVWILLAFLVYRGWLASRDRETSLAKACIIPLLMLLLSLHDLLGRFGAHPAPLAAWGLGAMAGTLLLWRLSAPVTANRAAGTVYQRGSWLPLAVMLSVFVVKYAAAVTFAMRPGLAQAGAVALPVALVFGLLNGALLGRLAPAIQAWLSAPHPAHASAA